MMVARTRWGEWVKKIKGNIVNNTVIGLHGNRWLLDLVW